MAVERKMSMSGLKLLKSLEGLRLKTYADSAGLLTIGVGHLLTDIEKESQCITIDGELADFSDRLTITQVNRLLQQDVVRFEKAVNKLSLRLNQHQFDALCCFAFNIGVAAFTNSTLYKQVKVGNLGDVPIQLRRWTKAGMKTVQGLVNRREKEIELWLKPVVETPQKSEV